MKNYLFKFFFLFFLSFFLFILFKTNTFAQETLNDEGAKTYKAIIIEILEEKELDFPEMGITQKYQKIKLKISEEEKKDEEIIIENGLMPQSQLNIYKEGEKVLITGYKKETGEDIYYITDYIRTPQIAILFFIFLLLAVFIGKNKGFLSLVSMGISFLIIFLFLLPQIHAGKDPTIIAIISSIFIIPITFYLSHGFNKKTTIAILGTLISLIITGILAVLFVNATKLSGGAMEEALFLQGTNNTYFNLKGLLLAGIIIGTLGIMDDITISQTSIVFQLHDLKKDIKLNDLYKKSMALGKDHIASMINTLILVYAGASMPLLLLFLNESRSFTEIINLEAISTEIVRTLVGSIGLITAVPITTYLATLVAKRNTNSF